MILILVGLAAKIGWAPVHNWLPDAHSEAPPPVSALLSAALLPTVMLIAWRVLATLGPALRDDLANATLLAFGLASLAIAVPFLWRPMAWKRLLAYSSLEHMGVLALGIGFATPLATVGRGVAPRRATRWRRRSGSTRRCRCCATSPTAPTARRAGSRSASARDGRRVGVSLGSLSGLPPSPLFFSELLILLGGIAAGQLVVTGSPRCCWRSGSSASHTR